MRKLRLFVICALLTVCGLKAQTVPPVLENMLNNTLDSMQLYINNKSLSAAIQISNDAVWAKASGISSVVPFANVPTADSYQIGSITKTLTAGCILHLADQGLLSLDDSLHQWIDTISYVNPDITIRQLLRHQTGLYNFVANPSFEATLYSDMDSVWSAKDVISTFILPPPGVPGGSFSYCNTNYLLLSMIIESVTGNPFYDEIRSRFLAPLSISGMAIPSIEPFSSPVAHVWLDLDSDGITDDAHSFFFPWASYNSAAGAAGAYYGTPSELTQWMKSYMKGDFHSASMMADAQTTISAGGMPITGYGLGLMKKTFAGYTGYGHGGDVVYSATSWYFPAKDISITVMNNDADLSSWQLGPVVTELLKTYDQWEATSVPEGDLANINVTAYPNPFRDDLSLSVQLKTSASSFLVVLTNTLGEETARIEKQNVNAGDHLMKFDRLDGLSSGMYFVRTFIDGHPAKTLKIVH